MRWKTAISVENLDTGGLRYLKGMKVITSCPLGETRVYRHNFAINVTQTIL